MKRYSVLLLPLLVACQSAEVKTPESYNLSGTISGSWGQQPRLRLALVGTGLPNVYTNDSTYGQNVVDNHNGTYSYGFDLPNFPNLVGVYQVVAFNDANNDATYDIGEEVGRNFQWLIYSPSDTTTPAVKIPEQFPWAAGEEAIPALKVSKGWNVFDRTQPTSINNPRPAGTITGYDITR